MPELKKGSKGLEKLLLQVSKGILEPILPMLFLILETYVSNGQLRNSDLSGLETDGMRANLIAESDENGVYFETLDDLETLEISNLNL